MRRSLAIGIVGGCVWLQLACGSGVLSGGSDAGPRVGTAGAGGRFPILGTGGIGGIGGGGVSFGDGGDPYAACNRPTPVVPVPPTHVLVLDSSSAMDGLPCTGCGITESRWANAVEALNATVSVTQADVRWGLDLFGDATNACGTFGAFDVSPALGAASSIEAALGARTDGDGGVTGLSNRPTRSAVLAATRQLMFLSARSAGAASSCCSPRARRTARRVRPIR